MSDADEKTSDSFDSDQSDEWQDYFSDQEDEILDDDNLPPVAVNEEKYKCHQCSICFEDLDMEIGSPDTCVHMFCLKCITLWEKISKTCPEDGRKFSQILKFVQKEGKIMYQHEKSVKIPCGKPDLPPESPQTPQNCSLSKMILNPWDRNDLREPVWRYQREKYLLPKRRRSYEHTCHKSNNYDLPASRSIQEQLFSHRRTMRHPQNHNIEERNHLRYNIFNVKLGHQCSFIDVQKTACILASEYQ